MTNKIYQFKQSTEDFEKIYSLKIKHKDTCLRICDQILRNTITQKYLYQWTMSCEGIFKISFVKSQNISKYF